MKMHAVRIAALLLGLGLATAAWGDGHHFHNVGSAAGHAAGGEHGHAPGGPGVAPHGGGYFRNVPPAAAHGAHFASGGPQHWQHAWGHGDIHYFGYHDRYYWNHGYWNHSWYGGRFGWWWIVSGVWFFYPVPAYPYPDPYVPSSFESPPPPPDVQDAPPAPAAATDQFWYFCPASNAYYPYVPACPTGWQQVLASDAQQQAQPPQPPNPPPPGG